MCVEASNEDVNGLLLQQESLMLDGTITLDSHCSHQGDL